MAKSLGEVALSYSEKLHFKVFPLRERSKEPATFNGCKDASSDTAKIKAWWGENNHYNIGLSTDRESGVWALDVDGQQGIQDLKDLEAKYAPLPKTPIQQTTKGFHYLFKHPSGVTISNRTKIIRHDCPEGLDVRGNGGYILLAPSIHPDSGKAYKWVIKPSECPVAEAPSWLVDLVIRNTQAPIDATAKVFNPPSRILKRTNPQAIIEDQLVMVSQAQEGSRNHTLNVAAMKVGKVIDKADISEATAKKLLASAAKGIGLEDREIEQTINSGLKYGKTVPYEYGRNTPPQYNNNDNVKKNSTDRKSSFDESQNDTEIVKINKFNLLTYNDLLYAPKVEWIIKGIFPKKSFGTIYGIPGKGKTFVALDMALCVAHGMQWHGLDVTQGSVLYIAGEGIGGLPKRLRAWESQYAPDEDKPPFYAIAANVNMREPEDVNAIVESIDALKQKFSLIFIDTVARAILGGDENSSTDMGLFVAACDHIKEHTGAAIIGVHHSGKDEEKGMRGSSALLGAVDTVVLVSQEEDGMITLKNEKQKDAELFKDIQFKSVIIATGIDETSLILEPPSEVTNYQKKVNKKVDLYLEALWDSIAEGSDKIRGMPAVRINTWRDLCYKKELGGGDNIDAKKKAFQRAKVRLQDAKKIVCEDGLVSIVQEG